MLIEDFVSNRWSDARAALRKLDPDYVDRLDSLARLERLQLYMPPDWSGTGDQPPKQRLSKEWHELLEACFELIVQTRNYQTAIANMLSKATESMSDIEAGRHYEYSLHTWLFYQNTVVEHVKTVISFVVKLYASPRGSSNQVKRRYHRKVDALRKRILADRKALVHGGGLTSRALTEGQWWEGGVATGMLPWHLLDEFTYENRISVIQ